MVQQIEVENLRDFDIVIKLKINDDEWEYLINAKNKMTFFNLKFENWNNIEASCDIENSIIVKVFGSK